MGCNKSTPTIYSPNNIENPENYLQSSCKLRIKNFNEDEDIDLFFAKSGQFFKCNEEEILCRSNSKKILKQILNWSKIFEYYNETESSIRLMYHLSRKNIIKKYIFSNLVESDAEIGLSNYMILKPKKFFLKIRQGPPAYFRWLAWKACLKFHSNFIEGYYDNLKNRKCIKEYEENILKDVSRTYQQYPLFSEYRYKSNTALYNILRCYAIYNAEVGYCQGMNYLVAFLLIVSGFREEECFWVFLLLMNNYISHDKLNIKGLKDLYSNGFPLLQIMNDLFLIIATKQNSNLRKYFDSIGISELVFFSKWALSMFLYSFPLEYCLRIWDYILAEGYSFLLTFSLRILDFLKEKILQSDLYQINELFSNLQDIITSKDLEKILLDSTSYEIEWKILEDQRVKLEEQIKDKIQKIIEKEKEDNKILVESDSQVKMKTLEIQPEPISSTTKNLTDKLFRDSKLFNKKKKLMKSFSSNSQILFNGNYSNTSNNKIKQNSTISKHNPEIFPSTQRKKGSKFSLKHCSTVQSNEIENFNALSNNMSKENNISKFSPINEISIIEEEEEENISEKEDKEKGQDFQNNYYNKNLYPNQINENNIQNEGILNNGDMIFQSKIIENKISKKSISINNLEENDQEKNNSFQTPNTKDIFSNNYSDNKKLQEKPYKRNSTFNYNSKLSENHKIVVRNQTNSNIQDYNEISKKSNPSFSQEMPNKNNKSKNQNESLKDIIDQLNKTRRGRRVLPKNMSELFLITIDPNKCSTNLESPIQIKNSD